MDEQIRLRQRNCNRDECVRDVTCLTVFCSICWCMSFCLIVRPIMSNIFPNAPKHIHNQKRLVALIINSHKRKSTAAAKEKLSRSLYMCIYTKTACQIFCDVHAQKQSKAYTHTHRFHNRNFSFSQTFASLKDCLFHQVRSLHTYTYSPLLQDTDAEILKNNETRIINKRRRKTQQ